MDNLFFNPLSKPRVVELIDTIGAELTRSILVKSVDILDHALFPHILLERSVSQDVVKPDNSTLSTSRNHSDSAGYHCPCVTLDAGALDPYLSFKAVAATHCIVVKQSDVVFI